MLLTLHCHDTPRNQDFKDQRNEGQNYHNHSLCDVLRGCFLPLMLHIVALT